LAERVDEVGVTALAGLFGAEHGRRGNIHQPSAALGPNESMDYGDRGAGAGGNGNWEAVRGAAAQP
jgi:hypothetical protein